MASDKDDETSLFSTFLSLRGYKTGVSLFLLASGCRGRGGGRDVGAFGRDRCVLEFSSDDEESRGDVFFKFL